MSMCITVCVLPQVNGPDVSLYPSSRAQNLPTVFPQTLKHHLHGVLYITHRRKDRTTFNIRHFTLFSRTQNQISFYISAENNWRRLYREILTQ